MNRYTTLILTGLFALILFSVPEYAYAMHIMEGFLPAKWSIFWSVLTIPFLVRGLRTIKKKVEDNPSLKLLLGVAGAFAFILSALKMPSVTGSSSHPTGVGLGAILFGPTAMTVIGVIVLLFQAILLAHGGITTLGANTFSMAVAGPFVAYWIFKLGKKIGLPTWLSVFLAAFAGDLITYVVTSVQLAAAFPAAQGGVATSVVKFLSVFAVTQLPLAVSEGILTVIVFNFLKSYNQQELKELSVIGEEV
ncbi:cobalamin biosynthesis protein CbiM [Thermincola ferriacetica]|uniref:Cobalt transport protein CbiM n=1 Tax=Thermincola ferriacetica TaxID=281456 RepID=A0A0L6W6P9_9FIRM|nr:energy-coupling factor ABC transporter permease [Thermincola ferriacetica]KNZ71141.1 cobalamin biosynthesis protein CbiM [Thermincola ferriacetica]